MPEHVSESVRWVGVKDPGLRRFDDLTPTPTGTTYNAYLVKAERPALVGAVPERFADELLERIGQEIEPRRIEFVILNHSEPDHSGAVAALLDAAPEASVMGTRTALHYLSDLLGRDFRGHAVADGEELDLGGRTLRFLAAPGLHWPDTNFAYLPEERGLFTCDAFGSHRCFESLHDDDSPEAEEDFRRYYDAILRPFRDKVLGALDRIGGLDIAWIAPGHGPLLHRDPQKWVDIYRQMADVPRTMPPTVAVFYLSAHGATERMARAVADGLAEAGAEPVLMHVTEASRAEQRDLMERACGLLFLSFTAARDLPEPMWGTLSYLTTVKTNANVAAAMGTYGWSGEARDMMEQRLKGLRLRLVEGAPKARFRAKPEDLEACRAFGGKFVQAMKECR